jgi:toxin ParE1/3/4
MTAPAVVFSPESEDHLDALHDYIAEHSGQARADAFVARIVTFCEGLSPFPERGTRRDDLRPGLRIIGFRKRVAVAFVLLGEAVVILGVFYGGQDYETAFRDSD